MIVSYFEDISTCIVPMTIRNLQMVPHFC